MHGRLKFIWKDVSPAVDKRKKLFSFTSPSKSDTVGHYSYHNVLFSLFFVFVFHLFPSSINAIKFL